MKRILILGSTGSIGTQTLEYIAHYPEDYKVVALICDSNISLLQEEIRRFSPEFVVVGNEEKGKELKEMVPETPVLYGYQGILEAMKSDYDLLINATVGISGLEPTYIALSRGIDVALANKEALVTGGKLLTDITKNNKARLLPIDSEHSAIFQSMQAGSHEELRKIYLTASGGPFRGMSLEALKDVTLEDALNHPNWSMGKKITIDSATMMNKGFEVMEAKWLFDVSKDDIEVLIHKESILHSMVEYQDGSIIAQLGTANMITPISYALTYPRRTNTFQEPLDFSKISQLNFEKPDLNVFKNLKFAYDVLDLENSYSVALNASNEVLVDYFLKGRIKFIEIQEVIEKVLDVHAGKNLRGIEEILEQDYKTREETSKIIGELS